METLIILVLVIVATIAALWWRRRDLDQANDYDAHAHRNDGYHRRGEGGGGAG